LEPEFVDEKFTQVLSHRRIRPHFHLSVQSGCKKILERMGRSYDSKTIEKAVTLLRGAKDDPFLACDIITGFPGETEEDFKETFNLCKKLDFTWIHVFPYSKRKGTAAFSYKDSVKESEVTKRVEQFSELAKQGRSAYIRRNIGKEVEVVVEKSGKERGFTTNHHEPTRTEEGKGRKEDKICKGVSENYLKVLVRCKGKVPPPGTVLQCKLIGEGQGHFDVVGEEI